MTASPDREQPPEHDLTRASYSPHATDGGGPLVFDNRCRRCWYDRSNVQNRALLEVAKEALEFLDRQREEYNAMPTLLPHLPYREGPIAQKLRAAIAAYEEKP